MNLEEKVAILKAYYHNILTVEDNKVYELTRDMDNYEIDIDWLIEGTINKLRYRLMDAIKECRFSCVPTLLKDYMQICNLRSDREIVDEQEILSITESIEDLLE